MAKAGAYMAKVEAFMADAGAYMCGVGLIGLDRIVQVSQTGPITWIDLYE